MSMPVLIQVYGEVRRMAIAGSVVAPGDFRLKKLIPQLEQSGTKAPVFAKVAEAAKTLVESDEKNSASALLELSTLVNAILYTQGETGADGDLTPLESVDLGGHATQTSARMLKPLLEALTETGSGRLEVIRDAIDRDLFRDMRLIRPALRALDDSYSEIADLMAERVLPMYGRAILPELRSQFDPKGKGGHVRRLKLMHQLDPDGTRDLVKQTLDGGSKEMKVAAISCLGDADEDLQFLLEQSVAKAQDVRTAALAALARSQAEEAVESLLKTITGNDLELAVPALRQHASPKILAGLLASWEHDFAKLLGDPEAKSAARLARRCKQLLLCLQDRSDKPTEQTLLKAFAKRESLAKVKGDANHSGSDVLEALVATMANATHETQRAVLDQRDHLPVEYFPFAFHAAQQSLDPSQVYDLFSGYLAPAGAKSKAAAKSGAKAGTKSGTKAAAKADVAAKGEMVAKLLGREIDVYEVYGAPRDKRVDVDWDPRWLDKGVELKDQRIVSALATPGHQGANAFLSEAFETQLNTTKDPYGLSSTLATMIRIQHPEAAKAVISALTKWATKATGWGLYWIARMIPDLPKSALPELEAFVPTLNDKHADQVAEYVAQLKMKPD